MPDNVTSMEALQERMSASPFNDWMGLRIESLTEDEITVSVGWREEMISNPAARYTHGGIIGAVIDTVADFMIAAKVGMPVPTVDIRIDYHRAAMPGDLTCTGRIVRLGSTNSVAEAYLRDGEGRLVASGRGTYFTAAARKD